jgi:hypothetical protein
MISVNEIILLAIGAYALVALYFSFIFVANDTTKHSWLGSTMVVSKTMFLSFLWGIVLLYVITKK